MVGCCANRHLQIIKLQKLLIFNNHHLFYYHKVVLLQSLFKGIFAKNKAAIDFCNLLCAICYLCNVNTVIGFVVKKDFINKYKNFIVKLVTSTSAVPIVINLLQIITI
jgi:hypothetical protein